MEIILGLFMLYSTANFLIVQTRRTYLERTGWEKFVTWAGIITIIIVFLELMYGY